MLATVSSLTLKERICVTLQPREGFPLGSGSSLPDFKFFIGSIRLYREAVTDIVRGVTLQTAEVLRIFFQLPRTNGMLETPSTKSAEQSAEMHMTFCCKSKALIEVESLAV